MNKKLGTPMLSAYEAKEYWEQLRKIIREEMKATDKDVVAAVTFETPGLNYKPLYKMKEVCALLSVTRPTIYDWVKHGKLKPYKIRSRVYFLWDDVRALLQPGKE